MTLGRKQPTPCPAGAIKPQPPPAPPKPSSARLRGGYLRGGSARSTRQG